MSKLLESQNCEIIITAGAEGVPVEVPEAASEVEETGSDYSEGGEEGLKYEKIDTPDGFKLGHKHLMFLTNSLFHKVLLML